MTDSIIACTIKKNLCRGARLAARLARLCALSVIPAKALGLAERRAGIHFKTKSYAISFQKITTKIHENIGK